MAVLTGFGVILAISASRSFAPGSVCLASTTITPVFPMMIVLFPPAPPSPAHTSGFSIFIVIGGGATTTGVAAITAAGPNNAAGVWNRRNLFTYADSIEISRGRHQISAGVWFQRMRDNENTASRTLGQASFLSLTTFLQGTVTTFQAVPNATALGWRSTFGAWYFQDAIRLLRGHDFGVELQFGNYRG